MLEQYPNDVKVVFKNFPLRNHAFARKAAIAAAAAQKQGKFWEFHDKLFANYNRLSDQKIEEIAQEVGLDKARFDADRQDPEVLSRVNADARDGQRAAVRGTPTVYVNGKQLQDRSMDGFRAMIDSELRKAGKEAKKASP
ncbi:MAG: hypothetical protein Kow0092_07370 [Deferrisomatales bacterium]